MSDKVQSYIHPVMLSSRQKHLIWLVKLQRSTPSTAFMQVHPSFASKSVFIIQSLPQLKLNLNSPRNLTQLPSEAPASSTRILKESQFTVLPEILNITYSSTDISLYFNTLLSVFTFLSSIMKQTYFVSYQLKSSKDIFSEL